MPPNPANTQAQQILPIYTTPPPQPRSATHHRHPITNNLIRGPPPTHTDPSTSNGHPNQSSVFDTHTKLRAANIPCLLYTTTEPQTETQGHVNVPTPSFLEEITPQCTEPNARPRKRAAHGNISRTELPHTQHSLAKTVEGPPPSPQTEAPRSQRYSQRVPNQTKRNYNYISTSPIPLPQTIAISCLSDPAPTNQLATLSQDQQAKRTRHTQDTLPSTRKRTCSQTESQQHSPLTQIIDIVALSSQIVIQPTEQSTNSQPNKCTTRSQITSHNHHATQASRQ